MIYLKWLLMIPVRFFISWLLISILSLVEQGKLVLSLEPLHLYAFLLEKQERVIGFLYFINLFWWWVCLTLILNDINTWWSFLVVLITFKISFLFLIYLNCTGLTVPDVPFIFIHFELWYLFEFLSLSFLDHSCWSLYLFLVFVFKIWILKI